MKILKYLLSLIVLLLVIFLLLGLFKPSISYDSQVTIDRPASNVWAVMTDESRLGEWLPGFKKTELVSGTENTVGAISNVYFDENGKEVIMQETMKEIIPNKKMAMDFTMDFMDMEYEMNLNESNGKTILSSNTIAKGNGPFKKSLVALMKGVMKKQENANMVKIKEMVETN